MKHPPVVPYPRGGGPHAIVIGLAILALCLADFSPAPGRTPGSLTISPDAAQSPPNAGVERASRPLTGKMPVPLMFPLANALLSKNGGVSETYAPAAATAGRFQSYLSECTSV